MARRKSRSSFRTILGILVVLIIVLVLVAIFMPKSRFSVFLRGRFDEVWPDEWRTAPGGSYGRITVLFAPCAESDPDGIDDQLIRFIDSAESEIKAAIYDLRLDSVANAFLNAINRGVKVEVVYDGGNDTSEIKKLRRAGVKPVPRPESGGIMHNKFIVVDGRKVWTGSMNLTENGVYRNDNNAVIIESENIASDYIAEFDEMHQGLFGASSPENTPYSHVNLSGIEVEIYFSPEDGVQTEILSEIRASETEIVFMAFSFTSEPISELMAQKMDTGVNVRGIFERSQKSRYCRYDYLRKAGAEVQWDNNRYNMHHKVIIIDRDTVITGSYNFSNSANTRNDENCLIIHSRDIAEKYLEEYKQLSR